jgi:hypothetical protein
VSQCEQALVIEQGTSRAIVISGIVDAVNNPLDVTAWTIHAQARLDPYFPVLAEWVSGTPTGAQGQATATGDSIRLEIPYAMSSAWTFQTARLQVEMTEPGPSGRRERIGDQVIRLDPEIVLP